MIGHLTRDPEMKQIGDAILCKFTIAMNHRTSKGDDVCFVDVTTWGKQAEFVNRFFTKGKPILVEGKLKQDNWEKDGKKYSKHSISADTVSFIGKAGDNIPGKVDTEPMLNEEKRITPSDKISDKFDEAIGGPITADLPF